MKKLLLIFLIPFVIKAQLLTLFSDNTPNYNELYSIVLPDTIYLSTGNTTEIIFDNLGIGISGTFTVVVDSGASTSAGYTYTPTDTVSQNITYKINNQSLGSSFLKTTNSGYITDTTIFLLIGDSRTNSLTSYLSNLGGQYFIPIGTQGSSPNLNEGYDGRTWSWFESAGPFVFSVNVDFPTYLSTHGFSAPDYVVIRLGTNDVFSLTTANRESSVATSLSYADSLIYSIHNANADTKIGLILETPPANDSIFLDTYGETQTHDQYLSNIHYYNQQVIAKYGSSGTNKLDYVSLLPLYIGADVDNDFTDGVHENATGYSKEAQSIYNWIIINKTLTNETTIYSSDFSADADSWLAFAGTVTGNIDGIADSNDVLRYYSDATLTTHFAYMTFSCAIGDTINIKSNVYVPSGSTNVRTARYGGSIPATRIINDDRTTLTDTWEFLEVEFVASAVSYILRITAMPASGFNFSGANTTDDDEIYMKNIVISSRQ